MSGARARRAACGARLAIVAATAWLAACGGAAFATSADSLDAVMPPRARTPATDLPAPECESRGLGGGRVFIRGRAQCDAPPADAYAVVADFEHAAEFVSAMDSSRVVRRDSNTVTVRQTGTTRFVIARAVHMTLRFRPTPPSLLRFEIVDGDFPVYYGSWKFEPAPAGSRIVYDVTMQAPIFVPMFLVRPLAERILCRTLREVQAEVQRRERLRGG